jgi:hypothetical protein
MAARFRLSDQSIALSNNWLADRTHAVQASADPKYVFAEI